MKSFRLTIVLIAFAALSHLGSAETGCPEPDEILPCTCEDITGIELFCMNVTNSEELATVFDNSKRYRYDEVTLHDCSLQYLPRNMFDDVQVTTLSLSLVTLMRLFDQPPKSLQMLDYLRLDEMRIYGSMTWELLEPLTDLKVLHLLHIPVKVLRKDFSQYVNHKLELFMLYQTDTRKIDSGVFREFTEILHLEIVKNKISELKRDMFPTPFNVRIMNLAGNRLKSLPDDIFSEMPNLNSLWLQDNQLSIIPEPKSVDLSIVNFEGNPLRCDCRLEWVHKRGITHLRGKCESPSRLKDKELKDLEDSDFHC